ncbi:MAG: aspartate 1-decarboxylase [Deltaproteobacteria bacterium]|nr:aspartate 1-decarboxylase [Deltaproteobacteria bacterium]
MYRKFLRAKIHNATVTHADLHYEGSVTIPKELMILADIKQYEAVQIWNTTRGSRLETYAISAENQDSSICINGAAAHLVHPGDKIIIAAFVEIDEDTMKSFKPRIVFVDKNNKPTEIDCEIPGPHTRPR